MDIKEPLPHIIRSELCSPRKTNKVTGSNMPTNNQAHVVSVDLHGLTRQAHALPKEKSAENV